MADVKVVDLSFFSVMVSWESSEKAATKYSCHLKQEEKTS